MHRESSKDIDDFLNPSTNKSLKKSSFLKIGLHLKMEGSVTDALEYSGEAEIADLVKDYFKDLLNICWLSSKLKIVPDTEFVGLK